MAKCIDCGTKIGWATSNNGRCSTCHQKNLSYQNALRNGTISADTTREDYLSAHGKVLAERNARQAKVEEAAKTMTVTTEPTLPEVCERLEIVTAEAVLGTNIFRDLGQDIRGVFGGRGKGYQKALRELREHALSELRVEAAELGADAVVAVDLDYSEISGGSTPMLFLVASGTAVKLNTSTEIAA